MLTFDFRQWGIKARAITGASNQVPFVIARALTDAMKDGREAERSTMSSVFDRPTPYTLNSMMVKPASKRDLTAELSFKEFPRPAWKWLGPEVEGGPRKAKGYERALRSRGILKGSEFTVPARGVKLDAYGNIPGSRIVQILSQLGAAETTAGYKANMIASTRKRAIKRSGGQFFVNRGGQAHDGIYQRIGSRAVAILLFVAQPKYKKRLPYHEVARSTVPPAFHRRAQEAWDRYIVKEVRRVS